MNIPKGKTACYDSLTVGSITVNGQLKVKGVLTAKHIQGCGHIEAAEVVCDTLRADTLRAETVTAQKIAVKKLFVRDCRASAAIVAADFAESAIMRTARLTVSLFCINELATDELIVLPQKKRGMLGTLFAGWLRSLFSRPPKKLRKAKAAKPAKAPADPKKEQAASLVEQVISELEQRGYLTPVKAQTPAGSSAPVIDIVREKEEAA